MSRQDNKGQSLSVQTLIVVALGILILLGAIIFYQKYMDRSNQTISSCTNQNGVCKESCIPGSELHNALGQCGEGSQCCVAIRSG